MLRYEFNKGERVMCTQEDIINPLTGQSVRGRAIWDTGASGTVINKDICDRLNMFVVATSKGKVAGSKDEKPSEVVFGAIQLSNGAIFNGTFTKQVLPDGVDMLIGMDVITSDRFSVFKERDCLVMEFGTR